MNTLKTQNLVGNQNKVLIGNKLDIKIFEPQISTNCLNLVRNITLMCKCSNFNDDSSKEELVIEPHEFHTYAEFGALLDKKLREVVQTLEHSYEEYQLRKRQLSIPFPET